MKTDRKIRLSPSSLSLYRECAKCFWLQKIKAIHRPQQSFALQSNFDRILKDYFDKYRERKKLPPEIKDQVKGELFYDYELLTKFRDALQPILKFTHPKHKKFVLVGGLDDCLLDNDYFVPIDFKTTGSSNYEKNSQKYYQHQLDIYNFLLKTNGYPHKNIAYLLYYKPKKVLKAGIVSFEITVKEMRTSDDRARKLFEDAIKLLSGPMPKSHSGCEFCSWGNDFIE